MSGPDSRQSGARRRTSFATSHLESENSQRTGRATQDREDRPRVPSHSTSSTGYGENTVRHLSWQSIYGLRPGDSRQFDSAAATELAAQIHTEGARRIADVFMAIISPLGPLIDCPLPFRCKLVCWLDISIKTVIIGRLVRHMIEQPYGSPDRSLVLQATQMALGTGNMVIALAGSGKAKRLRGPIIVFVDLLCALLHACQKFKPLAHAVGVRVVLEVTQAEDRWHTLIQSSGTIWYLTFRPGLLQLPAVWLLLDILVWVIDLWMCTTVIRQLSLAGVSKYWVFPEWLVVLLVALGGLALNALMAPRQPRHCVRLHGLSDTASAPPVEGIADLLLTRTTDDAGPSFVNSDTSIAPHLNAPVSPTHSVSGRSSDAPQADLSPAQAAGYGTAPVPSQPACAQQPTLLGVELPSEDPEECVQHALPGLPDQAEPVATALMQATWPALAEDRERQPEAVPMLPSSPSSSSQDVLPAVPEPNPWADLPEWVGDVPAPRLTNGRSPTASSTPSPRSPLGPPGAPEWLQIMDHQYGNALATRQEMEEFLEVWLSMEAMRPAPDLLYHSEFVHFNVSTKFTGNNRGLEDVPLLQAAVVASTLTALEAQGIAAMVGPSVTYRGCVRLLHHVAAVVQGAPGSPPLQDAEGGALDALLQQHLNALLPQCALASMRLPLGVNVRHAHVDVPGPLQVIPQPFAVLPPLTGGADDNTGSCYAGSMLKAAYATPCRVSGLRLLLPEGVVLAPLGTGSPQKSGEGGAAAVADSAWHLRVVVSAPSNGPEAAPLMEQRWSPAQLAELPLDAGGRHMLLLSEMATVPPGDIARAAKAMPMLLVSVLRTRGPWPVQVTGGIPASHGATSAHVEDELLCCAPVLMLRDAAACTELNSYVREVLRAGNDDDWTIFANHLAPLAWDLAAALCSVQRASYVASHGAELYYIALRKLLRFLQQARLGHCLALLLTELSQSEFAPLLHWIRLREPTLVAHHGAGRRNAAQAALNNYHVPPEQLDALAKRVACSCSMVV